MSSETMFAWQSPASSKGLDEDLVFNPEAPMPAEPKKGPFTLVKIITTSLNPADIKVPLSPLLSPMVKKPITPGVDFVGTVAKTTDPGFEVGDLVIGIFGRLAQQGALGEYTLSIPGDLLIKLDPSLRTRADELACIPVVGMTALTTLSGLNKGDKVFINGSSGGMGTFCVQIARNMGLTVVATCSARNADFVRDLGADVILDYNKVPNILEALEANVKETCVQFARVLDNVGSDYSLFYQAHRYMVAGGEFHFIAFTPVPSVAAAAVKMMFWPGFLGGGKRKLRLALFLPQMDTFQKLLDMVLKGEVRVVVDEVFELERAREAYKKLRQGHARGKIAIRVSQ